MPKRLERKPRGQKNKADVLSIDLPANIADEVNMILAARPFSRSRFGLLALELALPELRR